MPSAKLLIQKHEEEQNSKILQVIIEEDVCPVNVHYGKWTDGTIDTNKKNSKSPCLIVKIVSTVETDALNIESSAKLLEPDTLNEYLLMSIDYPLNNQNINKDFTFESTEINTVSHANYVTQKDYINPLQYSLDRVNANNARIMENIKILNRTLDMTKTREYLDKMYSKSLRYPSYTHSVEYNQEVGVKRHFNYQQIAADNKSPQRWQVVWTCIQCFQVWPQREQALNHSSISCDPKNLDHIREIKTSSLLQCEFCERVFTCIPRLLRHSKSHSVVNNYECSSCGLIFLSYKSNEQHWLICPWLKIYIFELPTLFLCNICDRKFKNYDQLYNHRYKAEHFLLKTYQDDKRGLISVLVHQCELCGFWYHTLSELKEHRVQVHKQFDALVY